jgi:urease accessory protein
MHTDHPDCRALRVRFDGSLDLAAGLLAPRVLHRDVISAEVALVATGATLLGGDRIEADLSVGAGRTLRVRDTSATVAYHGRGRPAALHTRIRVGPGALLVWDAQPLVLATGAEVERTLEAAVEAGGTLLLRDTLVLGRVGEDGGTLRCRTTASYDGRPALVESLTLDAGRTAVGMLGKHRVVDSALVVGARPDALTTTTAFDLAEPGRLVRWLGADAHTSPVASTWSAWRTTIVTGCPDPSPVSSV